MTWPVLTALGMFHAVLVAAYGIRTWADVRHRQCECAENVARIENAATEPKKIGF
jgi:hypothetical protein